MAVLRRRACRAASAPGTLYVIEPELDDGRRATLDAHGMDPVKVLALARPLGPRARARAGRRLRAARCA